MRTKISTGPSSGFNRMRTILPPPRCAFTLIEMLVVIAVIAILAALLVGGLGRSSESKVRSRVKVELKQLEGAIDSFHKRHGFYPADNGKQLAGNVLNTGTNQLFYELTSTSYENDTFTDILGQAINSPQIESIFGVKGFINSDTNKANFLSNLKPSGYANAPTTPAVRVLVVPYKGSGGDFNPWHYNSSNPEHNPDKYDLWAEVEVGGKSMTIGNWQD
jgi:prepilin-type N-terminal cleavage/methylation domain-containing protein